MRSARLGTGRGLCSVTQILSSALSGEKKHGGVDVIDFTLWGAVPSRGQLQAVSAPRNARAGLGLSRGTPGVPRL